MSPDVPKMSRIEAGIIGRIRNLHGIDLQPGCKIQQLDILPAECTD